MFNNVMSDLPRQLCMFMSICYATFIVYDDNDNRIQRRNLRFFTAPRTVSNMYAQEAWAQSCANHCNTSSTHHMQHVMLLAMWYERTAQLLNMREFKLYLFELLLAEPLTDEGGEESAAPRENSWQRVPENTTF